MGARRRSRKARAPRWPLTAGAYAALLAGPVLAWRAFLAQGTACAASAPPGESTASIATATCLPQAWEAWWRWPGIALGLALTLLALGVLVWQARRERASAQEA